jgi:predicted metal-dependent enzyme (double-stranded beta helix superfamily)
MNDEFICNTPQVRQFIKGVQTIINNVPTVTGRLAAIRPLFSQVMADPEWLPAEFRRTLEQGGMGQGIANWLLYRDTGGTLSLSALVLAHGAATPVHDHLAWGLVGLYVGEQEEEIYEPAAPVAANAEHSELKVAETKRLTAGSFYELIPPTGDIHRVITTSPEPSISLHLLGNDVGCILRHRFQPETGQVAPFRSGYSNVNCDK